ncbi:MAG: hypothetical protein IKQ60_05345 [Candidatus Methanomethylophilaceae archaeon]|nr:hypothetical protein [Candidatus Methanomethylophilaceae archaeon]
MSSMTIPAGVPSTDMRRKPPVMTCSVKAAVSWRLNPKKTTGFSLLERFSSNSIMLNARAIIVPMIRIIHLNAVQIRPVSGQ